MCRRGEHRLLDKNAAIVVVGAGAIGGVTAASLKTAGWNVQLVCKHREIADLAMSTGLSITGINGSRTVRLDAVPAIADLAGAKDLVLLATKATDCVAAASDLLPFLKPDAVVVSLQNGICEEDIAAVVGRDRVMGCVVGWGASMLGPGKLEITSGGDFIVGNIYHQPDDNLPFVRDLLDNVVPARISANIMGELYAKLIINSCINSLGVIVGVRLGKLLANHKVRRIFIALMREAMAVAAALGIKVAKGGGGKLDYYAFLEDDGFLKNLKRHLFIRAIGFKYRRIKSSSLQSIERGRRTEIDYLNGYIVDRGEASGVAVPVNTAVVAMIKQIETGSRKMGPANLENAAFGDL
jgi:2-dehydropantoate 2-reductase